MPRRAPKPIWVPYNAELARVGMDVYATRYQASAALSNPVWVELFYIPSKHHHNVFALQRSAWRGWQNSDSRNKIAKHHVPHQRTIIDWRDP